MRRFRLFEFLAVGDLERSRAFYLDGLGWESELDAPGEVLMIRAGGQLMLSLWAAAEFEAEVGPIAGDEGVLPFTLAHNVAEPAQVDAILALAEQAGARVMHPARRREWGGYSGYFADPDGFHWEIAMNSGPIGQTLLP